MSYSGHYEPATALSKGLEEQIAAMETLRVCLEDEHQALHARDPEQLLSIAQRKQTCLADAAQINRRCTQLEANAPPGDDRVIGKQREQLDTLTRLCRDLNNVNGTLIRRQKIRVDKTLQIMLGKPERSHLYDQSGNTPRQNPTRRTLASI